MKTSTDASEPLLLYANPEHVADLYYLSGLMTPDPYFLIRIEKENTLAVSPLEYGRALKEGKASRVVDTQTLAKAASSFREKGVSSEGSIALVLLEQSGLQRVHVNRDFPFFLARELMDFGVDLSVLEESVLGERLIKSTQEVDHIRDSVSVTQACIDKVKNILAEASVYKGSLIWQGEPLLSERIHLEIDKLCLEAGFDAGHPIVAGGDQACDPHERGRGVLRANELIIVDIFPRSKRHHYFGDITRTFLKGKPTGEQRRLVNSVAEAQKKALDAIREGVECGAVHAVVESYFEGKGYPSGVKNGVYQGFFHGTGHGIGLEIHEPPRLGKGQKTVLKQGMVVTVEPGLYYPGKGACRIEDDVLVTRKGCEVLSDYPTDWVLD